MNADAAPRSAARKRKMRWAIGGSVALVLVIAAIAGSALLRPKKSNSSALETAPVSSRSIHVVVSGTGSSTPRKSVSVNPKISGTVTKLYVSVGDKVQKGDKLYRISGDDVATQMLKAEAALVQSKQGRVQALQTLQEAKARVYSARTDQIQAQQDYGDLKSLPTTTTGIGHKLRLANRKVASAKKSVKSAKISRSAAYLGVDASNADVASAQQSYDDAVQATKDTLVTAPIDGVVTAVPISVGSDVAAGSTSSSSGSSGASTGSSAGSTASGSSSSSSSSSGGTSITIARLDNLMVEVSISEVDIPMVSVGQTASVTFDARSGVVFDGTVHSVSPNGTTSSGVVNYAVDLYLKKKDARLKPDMTATADISTASAENVLAVPSAAVKTKSGEKYVVVLQAGGATKDQPVTVGLSDDSYTEIKSGLSEGQTVVTGSGTSTTKSSGSGGFPGGGGPGGGGPGGM